MSINSCVSLTPDTESRRRKVILDKSFLQAESKDSRRLHMLRDAGAIFVITDTLFYELCSEELCSEEGKELSSAKKKSQSNGNSDERKAQWPATQAKLFPFADSIEVWKHTSDLLWEEITMKTPTVSPIDEDFTLGFQNFLRNCKTYKAEGLEYKEYITERKKEREIDTLEAILDDCRNNYLIRATDFDEAVNSLAFRRERAKDYVQDKKSLDSRIREFYGNIDNGDLYICGAENGLSDDWFAYHNTKTLRALHAVYFLKYGKANKPGIDFTHTIVDANYISLLHYADILATDETAGSIADMCEWVYGSRKVSISTKTIDKAVPSDTENNRAAYALWEERGRTHGFDVEDWRTAKKILSIDFVASLIGSSDSAITHEC